MSGCNDNVSAFFFVPRVWCISTLCSFIASINHDSPPRIRSSSCSELDKFSVGTSFFFARSSCGTRARPVGTLLRVPGSYRTPVAGVLTVSSGRHWLYLAGSLSGEQSTSKGSWSNRKKKNCRHSLHSITRVHAALRFCCTSSTYTSSTTIT